MEMFEYIWETREHKCFVTGKNLDGYYGTPFFLNLFMHIVRKAQGFYPEFKLNINNMILGTPELHHVFDNATLDGILAFETKHNCSFAALFELEEILVTEHNKEFGKNRVLRKIISLYRQKKGI